MDNSTMTNGLVSTWVTTRDASGRVHLEAHWVPVPSAAAAAQAVPESIPQVTHAA